MQLPGDLIVGPSSLYKFCSDFTCLLYDGLRICVGENKLTIIISLFPHIFYAFLHDYGCQTSCITFQKMRKFVACPFYSISAKFSSMHRNSPHRSHTNRVDSNSWWVEERPQETST